MPQQSIADRGVCQVLQHLLQETLRYIPHVFDVLACQAFPRLAIFAEDFADKEWIGETGQLMVVSKYFDDSGAPHLTTTAFLQ